MSTVPTDPPVPSYILSLVGPLLVGALMSSILFGIFIIQLYLYNLKFSNDKFLIQFSVYMIFALDVFLTIAVWALDWHVLCFGWGRIFGLGRLTALVFPGWTLSSLPIGTGILSAWVQIFYAWRIHVMVYWKVIPIVIVVVALTQAGAALATGITLAEVAPIKNFSDLHHEFPEQIVWLGGAALADVIITISMVYILYSAKRRAFANRHTEKVINRLIRSTFETGAVTSICAILELSFAFGFQFSTVHIAFLQNLSKLYSNTLMTSLNSRSAGSFENQDTFGTVTISQVHDTDNTSMGIHVATEVEVSDQHLIQNKSRVIP